MEIKLQKRYKYAGDIHKALVEKAGFPIDVAGEFINSIKDAEVIERRCGEWIKTMGMAPPEYHGKHQCSVCGRFAYEWRYHERLSDYCPHCGAKMDGGNHEKNSEN